MDNYDYPGDSDSGAESAEMLALTAQRPAAAHVTRWCRSNTRIGIPSFNVIPRYLNYWSSAARCSTNCWPLLLLLDTQEVDLGRCMGNRGFSEEGTDDDQR